MPSLVGCGRKTKFRPCRADVPKRTILYAPWDAGARFETVAYGERVEGLVLASKPASSVPVRSGVGTAHHLRKFPVRIVSTGDYPEGTLAERWERYVRFLKRTYPYCKPKIVDSRSVRVILWADDVAALKRTTVGNYRVVEE